MSIHPRAQRSDVSLHLLRRLFALRLQCENQPVFPDGEADARRLRPFERLRKSIVAAAAQYGALRAQSAVGELERRARVVVESAHHAVVDRVRNPGRIEHRAHRCEMFTARLVKICLLYTSPSPRDGLLS